MTLDEMRDEPYRMPPAGLPANLYDFYGRQIAGIGDHVQVPSSADLSGPMFLAASHFITRSGMVTGVCRRERSRRDRLQRKPWFTCGFSRAGDRSDVINNRRFWSGAPRYCITADVLTSLRPYPTQAFPVLFRTELALQSLLRVTAIPRLPFPEPPLQMIHA